MGEQVRVVLVGGLRLGGPAPSRRVGPGHPDMLREAPRRADYAA